eukprot:6155329-Prymnesium_polylepis.1
MAPSQTPVPHTACARVHCRFRPADESPPCAPPPCPPVARTVPCPPQPVPPYFLRADHFLHVPRTPAALSRAA